MAITVLDAERLEEIPASTYGDFLRTAPGVNVSQMSARDIQVTSRSATSTASPTATGSSRRRGRSRSENRVSPAST